MIRDNGLSRLAAATTHEPQGDTALLVDGAASPEALYQEAETRLTAAQAMLFTVATGSDARVLEGQDVANIAQAAQLLTADALDLMRAMHSAHHREATRRHMYTKS